MEASQNNPIYSVFLIVGTDKYEITPAVISISMSNQDKQVAQSVTLTLANVKATAEKTLCQLLQVRQRVFIYANDGKRKDEVFRGWTWTKYHDQDNEQNTLQVKCYDNLIYLQESQDSLFFGKGNSTTTIMSKICDNWGIKLNYKYSSITHEKLVLRGTLTDIIKSDILDKVKARTGTKYVVTSQQDVMTVAPEGSNATVYSVTQKNNAVLARYETTMDGMTTQVKILGNAGSGGGQVPVLATVSGDTAQYGTLQKLASKDKEKSLADAKKEAQNTIDEDGSPHKEYVVTAIDIPWIIKGDKVYVEAGHITGQDLIVAGLERDISNKARTMTLTLRELKQGAKE